MPTWLAGTTARAPRRLDAEADLQDQDRAVGTPGVDLACGRAAADLPARRVRYASLRRKPGGGRAARAVPRRRADAVRGRGEQPGRDGVRSCRTERRAPAALVHARGGGGSLRARHPRRGRRRARTAGPGLQRHSLRHGQQAADGAQVGQRLSRSTCRPAPSCQSRSPPALGDALRHRTRWRPRPMEATTSPCSVSVEDVRTLRPDLAALAALERTGVVVTAPGDGPYDFVSRYCAPAKGIDERPGDRRGALRARPVLGGPDRANLLRRSAGLPPGCRAGLPARQRPGGAGWVDACSTSRATSRTSQLVSQGAPSSGGPVRPAAPRRRDLPSWLESWP